MSQDVDLGIPIGRHAEVKERLGELRAEGLRPSPEEPSVWLEDDPALLEVNFLGMDRGTSDPADTYLLEDPHLPLLVFGPLGLLEAGDVIEVEGVRIPVPQTAGLLAEKLVTARTGEKGDRDLLVAAGLLSVASDDDIGGFCQLRRALPGELHYAIQPNLTILSLMGPAAGMPDPRPQRRRIAEVLRRLETEAGT